MLSETIEEKRVRLYSEIRYLKDWFDDYDRLIKQFEREERLQSYPVATVEDRLLKLAEGVQLSELINFSKDIISLEVEACLKLKQLQDLEEEFYSTVL